MKTFADVLALHPNQAALRTYVASTIAGTATHETYSAAMHEVEMSEGLREALAVILSYSDTFQDCTTLADWDALVAVESADDLWSEIEEAI
jgi:hypothetical protein